MPPSTQHLAIRVDPLLHTVTYTPQMPLEDFNKQLQHIGTLPFMGPPKCPTTLMGVAQGRATNMLLSLTLKRQHAEPLSGRLVFARHKTEVMLPVMGTPANVHCIHVHTSQRKTIHLAMLVIPIKAMPQYPDAFHALCAAMDNGTQEELSVALVAVLRTHHLVVAAPHDPGKPPLVIENPDTLLLRSETTLKVFNLLTF